MKTHKQLVQHLVDSGVLSHQSIIDALKAVDRADFVPEDVGALEIYGDYPLPIGYGQTISQPTTVAFMLELLQPQAGDKILDVGSGSGWTSALLGHIVGESGFVFGVEIVPELVNFSRRNVARYPEENITISQASHGQYGNSAQAPYDRILVSAAAREIPPDLLTQLKVGGVLVIPVGNDIMALRKKSADDYELRKYPGFVFVPLIA